MLIYVYKCIYVYNPHYIERRVLVWAMPQEDKVWPRAYDSIVPHAALPLQDIKQVVKGGLNAIAPSCQDVELP